MKKGKDSFYARYIKRLLDVLLSMCALLVLSPVLLIIALLVRVKLGSPVIFKQQRPGKDEKIFTLYKFRSMTDETDADGNLLPDDVRLTRFGRALRSTSLDELPELWNILKGDMSIVGPRPLMVSYLAYYTEEESHRHDVRPGITGLAQVNGRSFISWEEIFAYDLQYMSIMTFWNDLKIIWQTVGKVIGHKDIADITEVTVGVDGLLHVLDNGKDLILHQPLNIERKGVYCAEGNRQ